MDNIEDIYYNKYLKYKYKYLELKGNGLDGLAEIADNIEDIYYNKYLKYKYLELKGNGLDGLAEIADNIEDIYYNKYLKYKYKYLELKGNGNDLVDGLGKIALINIETNFYGPKLLEQIKSITKTNDINNHIWTDLLSSLFTGNRRVYEINLINNFENSLIEILDKISKKEELREISTDIKLLIDKINNNKIQEYNLRMINYNEIEIYINNLFNKYTLLKTYSNILKKLFNVYFEIIKKVKEQKK